MRVLITLLLLNLVYVGVGFAQESVTVHYEKGVQYTAQGKFKKAQQEFQLALTLDPHFQRARSGLQAVSTALSGELDKKSVILLYIGIDYYNSNHFSLAVEYMTRSISVNPRSASAYVHRSMAFLGLHKRRLAMKDGLKAVKIDRSHPVANLHLANMYRSSGALQLGQVNRAFNLIKIYDRAIKANSEYRQAYLGRAIAFSYMRKTKKALREFRYMIKRWPNYHMAYESIAVTYSRLKKPRKAIQYHSKAIVLDPTFPGSYFNRGAAYRELGRYDLALKDFTKAIEVDPKFKSGYLIRAQLYLIQLKKTDKACIDLRRACKMGPCNFLNEAIGKGICKVKTATKGKYDRHYMKTISTILGDLNTHSGMAFADNVNLRYIMGKVNKRVRLRSAHRNKLPQELRQHLEQHTSRISSNLTHNKPAVLIQLSATKVTATALIRLGYGQRDVSFIKLKLKRNDSLVSIVDWYDFSTGLHYSDFAATSLALLKNYRVSSKSFLSGMRKTDRNAVARLMRLVKNGQHNKALSTYKTFNLRIKKKRQLLSVLLFYTRSSDVSQLYLMILADLKRYHSKSAGIQLSLLTHYESTGNYSKAISILKHLMKGSLKRDPMLVAKMADMYAKRGEHDKAKKLAEASRASNPGLFLSNWVLLKLHASNKNYYQAFKLAKYINTKFSYDISKENLRKSASLRGFIKSQEYKFLLP